METRDLEQGYLSSHMDKVLRNFKGVSDVAVMFTESLIATNLIKEFKKHDINFGNMIVDPLKQELYLFDFLDSFVESPLQDFSSLRQDFAFGWFTVKKKFETRELLRAKQLMRYFDAQLAKTYG